MTMPLVLTCWEEEVAAWQQELSAAAAELDWMAGAAEERRRGLEIPFGFSGEVFLTPHLGVLERHRAALGRHGDRLRDERVILAGAAVVLADPLARHQRLRDAHERLGRHHQAVMATTVRVLRVAAELT
jgi:hypothetical protein